MRSGQYAKVGTNDASFGGVLTSIRKLEPFVRTSASSLPFVLYFMSKTAVRYRRTRFHPSLLWRASPIDSRLRLVQTMRVLVRS